MAADEAYIYTLVKTVLDLTVLKIILKGSGGNL